jgi:hypothetical protein
VVETADGEEWNWEQGTPVSAAIDELCGRGFPSERLCEQAPRCGDGFCSFDPVDDGCVADCGSTSCSGTDCVKSTHQDAEPGELAPMAPTGAAAEQCSMRAVPAGGALHWSALAALALVRGLRRRRRN